MRFLLLITISAENGLKLHQQFSCKAIDVLSFQLGLRPICILIERMLKSDSRSSTAPTKNCVHLVRSGFSEINIIKAFTCTGKCNLTKVLPFSHGDAHN